MRENASRGFFNGSTAPYGMHREPIIDGSKTRWRLTPDSDNSPTVQVIRRMFALAMKDYGCKEIAKRISAEGYRNRNGNLWNSTTVHQVLTNEAYCGNLIWGGRQGRLALKKYNEPVRVENAWQAIISRETFDIVKQKMQSKSPKIIHPRIVTSFYMLSGILYCSCGHKMIGRSAKSSKYHYYQCSHNYKVGNIACNARIIPKDKLERAVLGQLKEAVLTEDNLRELVQLVNEELMTGHKELSKQRKVIDAELNDITARLSKLYDALETGKILIESLAPRIDELKERQDKLCEARIQLEADATLNEVRQVDLKMVNAYVKDLKNLLDNAEGCERKSFIRSFVRRVTIKGNTVTIDYKLPMPPQNSKKNVLVLPFIKLGGAGGIRTRYLLTASL